jgi:site-specific DNA recombinase
MDEWIRIPVPALVGEELFAAVQEQLDENRRRARQGERGARWLLQGLICCAQCGYSYCGRVRRCNGQVLDYGYYRCTGNDLHRDEGITVCTNKPVRTDRVEAAVWREVHTLLEEPERLQQEYERRLQDGTERGEEMAEQESQLRKLHRGMGRLIDSYAEGIIEREDFTPRISRLKERIAAVERDLDAARVLAAQQEDLRLVIGRLDDFAQTVRDNLDQVDRTAKQMIIRTLVKRVEIDLEEIRVIFRLGPEPPDRGRRVADSQSCSRRLDGENVAAAGLEPATKGL